MSLSLLFLPHDHRVGFQVFHIDYTALAGYVRVFADHQPAHVWEEKSPSRVVWVGIRVGELVVNPMVSDPFVYVVLESQRLENGQQHSHGQTRVIAPVSPQSVSSDRYAQTATHSHHTHCNQSTRTNDNTITRIIYCVICKWYYRGNVIVIRYTIGNRIAVIDSVPSQVSQEVYLKTYEIFWFFTPLK